MQILLSTSNERICNIAKLIDSIDFSFCELLIAHQCTKKLSDDAMKFIENIKLRDNIIYFHLSSTGVTKSRNFLIKNSSSDFIAFCDDDIEYIPETLRNIRDIMIKDKIDILSGITLTPEGKKIKNYKVNRNKHTKLSILKVGTVEVIARRNALNNEIFFPEDMGAGEHYPICDEPVFLSRCIDKKLKVEFIPINICIHPPISSGMNVSEIFTQSRGLCFRRVFGLKGLILLIPFAIKMKIKKRNIPFFNYIKNLIRGFYAFK
jgi:glycosyltransferase involved in cell wall biosynthesis